MVFVMASAAVPILILYLAILISNEECHLFRCFRANVYLRYDYVHLDNMPDMCA